MRLRSWSPVAVLVAFTIAGCGGPGDPVASLSVEPRQMEVGYPGYATAELTWSFARPLGEVDGEPRVFLHLVDEQGNLARTFDHELPGGWREEGQKAYEVKIYQSALAPPLAAGEYDLVAGLYDRSNRRWPLSVEGRQTAELAYRVAGVTVAESSGDSPMFFFPSGWQPVEGGTDLQVLGRRWLSETGSLRLSEVVRPGSLWLMLGVPTGAGKVEDLVLDEGAATPQVVVTSDCSAELESVTVSGSGSHGLELPVEVGPDGEARECQVTFEANYYLVSLETLARRTVALENLAWSAR
ncbi:MAG: hypothetical protein R3325_02035 [Thermoanaerobaculia bacterium]|nr:hypothetical protein [Thermoanaerobaculia bacterium]